MYSFPLCISCIWHGICNMMYRQPCILDCMHFYHMDWLGKASPIYIVHHGMIIMSWFISKVDVYVFEKCHMYALL
jgi:hypothetical protein